MEPPVGLPSIYMKYSFLFVLLALSCYLHNVSAQSGDSTLLCQGAYYTEAEGRAALATSARTYHDRAGWEQWAARITKGIWAGLGISPDFARPPLRPIVRHRKVYDGYTVENVAFESLPGFFVTGNLYRPTQSRKTYPVILSTHGHFQSTDSSAAGYVARTRASMQLRCASLARMGAIVLACDMIGYGEADQTSHKHPQALALQTLNNLRAVDFLLSLPQADPQRVAVTGASGGGTQAILLTALDDRITVSVPVVMVSAHFFGGCACESGMPIHRSAYHQTNNVEIAALAAPRPQLLISDGEDWTKNTPHVEYPYLRNVYGLYGEEDKVENIHLPHEGHDYGPSKRAAAYQFLAHHLNLDLTRIQDAAGGIDESFVTVVPHSSLVVFDEQHPRPRYALRGDNAARRLLAAPSVRLR